MKIIGKVLIPLIAACYFNSCISNNDDDLDFDDVPWNNEYVVEEKDDDKKVNTISHWNNSSFDKDAQKNILEFNKLDANSYLDSFKSENGLYMAHFPPRISKLIVESDSSRDFNNISLETKIELFNASNNFYLADSDSSKIASGKTFLALSFLELGGTNSPYTKKILRDATNICDYLDSINIK